MESRVFEDRLADAFEHDPLAEWLPWQHLPFEVWPDAALISYLAGTGRWQSAFDGRQPTAAELRAIITEAIGCTVIPEPEPEEKN